MGRARDERRAARGGAVTERVDRRTFLRAAVAGGAVVAGGLGIERSSPRIRRGTSRRSPAGRRARRAHGLGMPPRWRRPSSTACERSAPTSGGERPPQAEPRRIRPATTINTEPRLIAATVLAFRRLGAASVLVARARGTAATSRTWSRGRPRRGAPRRRRAVRRPERRGDPPGRTALAVHRPRRAVGADPVLDADVVVSMPKMKTHHWTQVTLSLKNLFGTLPGRVRVAEERVALGGHRALDPRHRGRRPAGVRDRRRIVGMEGNGPISGEAVAAGVLVFADDPAADAVGAQLMGRDPDEIRTSPRPGGSSAWPISIGSSSEARIRSR